MKKSIIIRLAFVLLTLVVFTGCDNSIAVLNIGSSAGNQMHYTYKLFTGTKTKKISVEKGKTIVIDYSSEVKKGELTLKVFDPDKNVVLELEKNKSENKELKVEKDGEYKFVITGKKADGNISVKWDVK